jgi:hypothetical protein
MRTPQGRKGESEVEKLSEAERILYENLLVNEYEGRHRDVRELLANYAARRIIKALADEGFHIVKKESP